LSKIIIVGSSGFIGGAVARNLKSLKLNVIEIDRNRFDQIVLGKESIRTLISEEDSIIFTAAKVPVKTYGDYVVNLNLIKDFVNVIQGVKFAYLLNISSDAVYGDSLKPLKESDNLDPTSLHGCMHFTRETILNLEFPGKVGHLRPTLIFGRGDNHKGYGPNLFLQSISESSSIKLFGKGEELRDHIYINDVVKLVTKMEQTKLAEPLNAATGKVISFLDIALVLQKLVPDTEIDFLPRIFDKMPHNGFREIDISKIKQLVPDFIPTDLTFALTELVNTKA
jgi:nucleoside-diphosphate-sugar epimerase